MKKIITLGAILAACTFAVPAMAQRGDDRVDARQDRQQQRIENGYRSGDLTRREVRQLADGQRRIDRMQHQAYRDGRVTPRERERIHEEVARQDRRIYRERHDGDRWRGTRFSRYDGHDRGYHYGRDRGRDYGHEHAPVVRRVYVDSMPRISLVLNLP